MLNIRPYKIGRILTFIFLFILIGSLIPKFYTVEVAKRKTLRSATEYAKKLGVYFHETISVFPSAENRKEVVINIGIFSNEVDASKFMKKGGFKKPHIRTYKIYKIYVMYLPDTIGYFIEKNSLSYLLFFAILAILFIWLYRRRKKRWIRNLNEKTWLAMR